MSAVRCFDLLRDMKERAYNYRPRLVESASHRGIKRLPKLSATTLHTISKLLHRFQRHCLLRQCRVNRTPQAHSPLFQRISDNAMVDANTAFSARA
jgi:hypothetical protein